MSHFSSYDTIQIIDYVMQQAVIRRASDIHLEPFSGGTRVRFRIDGLLHEQYCIDQVPSEQLIARVKVIANIDVAQTRLAQDGKCTITVEKVFIDIRVSTFPSLYGQKIVMRLLYQSDTLVALSDLGMQEEMLIQVRSLMQRSSGFLLVSGPTGSGKTTTLYAILSALNTVEKNIITLEDPVEYCIAGITQGQVHTDIGFGFAQGMRALLRQDPDIVLIGEMRDHETMQTALQAALTGHMVLSTIHTIDAPSVIMRLMDMGIEPFLINASVTGIIAQRLARVLCISCKQAEKPTVYEQEILKKIDADVDVLYKASGCEHCYGAGFKGRTGIFELVIMDDILRQTITVTPSLAHIRQHINIQGFKTMMHDGIEKVERGIIPLEELMRCIW